MKILYKQEDNTIALVSPNPEIAIETVLADLPSNQPMIMVEDAQLPSNNDLSEFFDALTVNFSNSKIGFDIKIARELTKKRLRIKRQPLFQLVDLSIRDAMLENDLDKLNQAIAERDRLRDITKLVDAADDLSALRSIQP
jgi:hypothetical protein